MTINTLPVNSQSLQPRSIIRINGTVVPGCLSWEVTNNSFFEADTFRILFSATGFQQASGSGVDGFEGTSDGATWFAEQTETFVEILAGFPDNPDNPDPNDPSFASLIYGRVDDMNIDLKERLIDLKGRDLTAAFIDRKLTADYTNQSISAIVTQIAASHGFTTGNITPTRAMPGVFYQPDQVMLWADRSEWDLICTLARQLKFVCYVNHQDLYFGPDPLPDSNPYVIQWEPPTTDRGFPIASVVSLNFSRSQTVSKGITVTVSSANLQTGKAATASYPSAPRAIQPGKATPFGGVQPYPITAEDGLTPQQCVQRAEAIYHQLISHEMKLEATLPGDNLLTTRCVVQVTGTGTAFDQLYIPRSVTRRLSRDDGYAMTLHAQNQSPEQPL